MGAGADDAPSFELRTEPGRTVLRLEGEIDLAARDRLRDTLADAAGCNPDRLYLDLRAVTFLDSSGLHALLAARDLGPELVLIAPPPAVRRVLDLSAVASLFTIVDDEPTT